MIARIGVDLHNLIAIIPLPGTPLGKMSSPSLDLMTSRRAGERHLPQMYHSCAAEPMRWGFSRKMRLAGRVQGEGSIVVNRCSDGKTAEVAKGDNYQFRRGRK